MGHPVPHVSSTNEQIGAGVKDLLSVVFGVSSFTCPETEEQELSAVSAHGKLVDDLEDLAASDATTPGAKAAAKRIEQAEEAAAAVASSASPHPSRSPRGS